MYTGLWRAYGDETFDPDAFVDSLPEGLDKDWSLDEDALELGLPREHLRHNGTLVTVAVLEDGPGIGILAISRCGQVPDKPN